MRLFCITQSQDDEEAQRIVEDPIPLETYFSEQFPRWLEKEILPIPNSSIKIKPLDIIAYLIGASSLSISFPLGYGFGEVIAGFINKDNQNLALGLGLYFGITALIPLAILSGFLSVAVVNDFRKKEEFPKLKKAKGPYSSQFKYLTYFFIPNLQTLENLKAV